MGVVQETAVPGAAPTAVSMGVADKGLFDAALFELRKHVDTATEGPYLVLHAKAEARACRWAARLTLRTYLTCCLCRFVKACSIDTCAKRLYVSTGP
jgi:hypothetical protein